MTSTLFGLYNAQRSLSLNQSVIDIINNNISNVNTPGYSKQRAEIEQLTSGNYSTVPQNACQDSLGAVIADISRNREAYLDNYYRSENSNYNYYKELRENSELIEDITNELDDIGINNSLEGFYDALSQLSSNPNDIVIRNNVVQRAIELTTKFNSVYDRLNDLRSNLVGDISNPTTLDDSKLKLSIDKLNDKLSSVADLNDSIILSTSQGASPNYLLDQRDKLLDEISNLIPADITSHTNGSVTVSLGSTNLVSGGDQVGIFGVNTGTINNPAVVEISNPTGSVLIPDAYSLLDSGQIGGVLEIGGSNVNQLNIKTVMDNMDTLAQEFASAINTLQTGGQYIMEDLPANPGTYILTSDHDPANPPAGPSNFFVDDSGTTVNITAGNISVSDAVLNDPYQISAADAASDPTETGDGSNALAMSQVRDSLIAGLGGSSTQQYITNVVGDIGSKASTIRNNFDIKENVAEQVHLKRESVIGVNIDEEMTDLIRFQRAYEASARVFNVVNKNIQTIINMV